MLDRDILINGLLEGFLIVINIFKPYIIKIILGGISLGVIKHFANKLIYSFSVISGDSRGETRRKVRKSENLIDLISTINDIKPKK